MTAKKTLEEQFGHLSNIVKTLVEDNKRLKLKDERQNGEIIALNESLKETIEGAKIKDANIKQLYRCVVTKEDELKILKERIKRMESEALERVNDVFVVQKIEKSIDELLEMVLGDLTPQVEYNSGIIYESIYNESSLDEPNNSASRTTTLPNSILECSMESCDEDYYTTK